MEQQPILDQLRMTNKKSIKTKLHTITELIGTRRRDNLILNKKKKRNETKKHSLNLFRFQLKMRI